MKFVLHTFHTNSELEQRASQGMYGNKKSIEKRKKKKKKTT